MINKIVGSITRDMADKWHVTIYDGEVKNTFSNHKDAVDFIERELELLSRTYNFNVGYRIIDKIRQRRSFVLMTPRGSREEFDKTAVSWYEYLTSHYFFYSHDRARKIVDYKNPSFQHLTRQCLATSTKVTRLYKTIYLVTMLLLALIMTLFLIGQNNPHVMQAEHYADNSAHIITTIFLGVSILPVIGMYTILSLKDRKFKKIVRGNSSWHENYETSGWKAYYKYSKSLNKFAIAFSILFIVFFIVFWYFYSISPMFDAFYYVPIVRWTSYIFIIGLVFSGATIAISLIINVRFRVNLYAYAPNMLTRHGFNVYKDWINDKPIADEEMFNLFLPVPDHLIYPNSKFVNDNQHFYTLPTKSIRELNHAIENYYQLIKADKFAKKEITKDMLDVAYEEYVNWTKI